LIVFDLEPRGPFHADQELWDALSLHLHHIPQKVLDNLRSAYRNTSPMCSLFVNSM
jgi:hypothetical protein